MFHRLATVLQNKQHTIQLGDNTNLVDWVYAGNVADAHILAADRLPQAGSLGVVTTHPVAGQVFFITNAAPLPGWDFSRKVWRALGAAPADLDPRNVVKIPTWLALCLAFVIENVCKILGKRTEFSVYAVRYATTTQWYSIEKVGSRPLATTASTDLKRLGPERPWISTAHHS